MCPGVFPLPFLCHVLTPRLCCVCFCSHCFLHPKASAVKLQFQGCCWVVTQHHFHLCIWTFVFVMRFQHPLIIIKKRLRVKNHRKCTLLFYKHPICLVIDTRKTERSGSFLGNHPNAVGQWFPKMGMLLASGRARDTGNMLPSWSATPFMLDGSGTIQTSWNWLDNDVRPSSDGIALSERNIVLPAGRVCKQCIVVRDVQESRVIAFRPRCSV